MADRLGPEAWVRAGLSALATGGLGAVRVEPLAARLGVTKGSFYWHFADREALQRAMVDAWEQRATLAVIDEVEATGGTAAERLHNLLRISTTAKADRLEAAMRAWGATDAAVAKIVARVDRRRERFVVDLLEATGLSREEATVRTRLIYLALIGEYARTAHGAPASPTEMWSSMERLLLRP